MPPTVSCWNHVSSSPAFFSSQVTPFATEIAPGSVFEKKFSKRSCSGLTHSPAVLNSSHMRLKKIARPTRGLRSTLSSLSERESRSGSALLSWKLFSTESTHEKSVSARPSSSACIRETAAFFFFFDVDFGFGSQQSHPTSPM